MDFEPEFPKTTNTRYKCAACYKQYKKKEHLVEHINVSFHSVHQPRCGVCKKHFKSFESQREHVTGPLAKENCKRVFSEQGCDLCLKIFDSPNSLSAHKFMCRLSAPVPLVTMMERCEEFKHDINSSNEYHVGDGTEAIALDCEMVAGGSDGSLDLCARVCLIDEDETILFHTYVQPQYPVVNYRYEVTGLTEELLRDGMPLQKVQDKVLQILYNGKTKLLVGHSLENDLDCLRINYPDYLLRDTANYHPLMKTNLVSHPLKYLTRTYLGYDIQSGFHDPYEDCVSAMRLYKRFCALDHQKEGNVASLAMLCAKDIPGSFDSWETDKLEKMTLHELYEMSRPNYKYFICVIRIPYRVRSFCPVVHVMRCLKVKRVSYSPSPLRTRTATRSSGRFRLSSSLNSAAVALPSVELAHLLVSHICWANHVPITWKFLEKALTVKIVPPMLVLALLSTKVVPNRQLHPAAYRLYMELLKRHTFLFASQLNGPNCQKIIKSIDDVLHLSQLYGLQVCEPGVVIVEFVFSIICELLDASLDDEGLLELTPDKKSRWSTRPEDMEIDGHDCFNEKRSEQNEGLQKVNTAMAIEIIVELLQNKVTSRILCLTRRNLPSHWGGFIQKIQVLAANSSVLRTLKHITPESLLQLTSDTRRLLTRECKIIARKEFHAVLSSGSLRSSASQSHGVSSSAFWLPIDLFLEDAMDGSEVAIISAVETLTGLVKALQAVNGTTWHNTFLGLWIAALRLVQRERDPREGPVPRLDTCLCMLLSITTLAVTNIIEEEEAELMEEIEGDRTNQRKEQAPGKRRKAKAIMSRSGLTVSNGYYESVSVNDMPINCMGNLRHLIVEACIARNLLDTSAYFWPGYVSARSSQVLRNVPGQVPGWSSIMKGSPLTPSLVNALVATPASSLAEIEKIYEIAVNGSDEEKISAVTILCGASLIRGWNIQEHICLFIINLLSPPVPADYSGSDSHLISYASFFNVLLVGVSSVDTVQIFSLLGLVPLLAAALMPICEVFGSSIPNISWTPTTGEELSCHTVFSNAFTLLLRLWRFDHPPLEHMMGDSPTVGNQAGPEYLLVLRNSRLASFGNSPMDRIKSRRVSKFITFPSKTITMDCFPKLRLWFQQHQKCICSTLSGLVPGTPIHQIVDALLTMMFRKINRSSQPLTPVTSGSSNSSASGTDESSIRLKVPAWDILEATPFVLDAALTACAHGRLSPRELATGLKELADYLPATLATIVSYFSAEVTRGIWKPACMNGTDWPSPAANLSLVEQQIKKILAATGVDVPSLAVGGSAPAMLPLPFAALVSLTITYKLDRASERALTLIGQP
ncbi:mediator of RNA polymerase II transcription subunit 33B [Prunus yedoensis var. nudiflora]|uniref:RNA exonuclease 4 n=1 Tax=Prunus yedoensis var. nudiflora TaxID=2094558 RepID=A0A314ZJ33_PRUYE|nr:mediator of RNA polymerase II transcription subunit 33B [Prunus yedoensis var. nudiflora]